MNSRSLLEEFAVTVSLYNFMGLRSRNSPIPGAFISRLSSEQREILSQLKSSDTQIEYNREHIRMMVEASEYNFADNHRTFADSQIREMKSKFDKVMNGV